MTESLGGRQPMDPGAQEKPLPQYEIRPYRQEEALLIYKELEEPNWAPWLRASSQVLAKRAAVFPEGQIAVWSKDGRPIANLNLSRFSYNGDPKSLPTWDELMGNPATGENTFDLNGNALGMMSINIHPEFQGVGLTRVIIDAAKKTAKMLGTKHVMGSFRPSQFGEYSHEVDPRVSFSEYVNKKRADDNLPQDAWLRALTRNGMSMLRIDEPGMVVSDVSKKQFEEYRRNYNPEKWTKISVNVWRCGETGMWLVGDTTATYVESNVWGILQKGS